ncbi:MAG: hypothetical protein R6V12_00235, partial [Candidatus Hydrogenedentota bacterium]
MSDASGPKLFDNLRETLAMWHLTNSRYLFCFLTLAFLCAAVILAVGCGEPIASGPGESAEAQSPTSAPESSQEEADEEGLEIVGVLPLAGEPLRDRIVFFFNAPVEVAAGADSAEPFTIDPPVQGDFRVDQNFAAFQAKEPFPEDIIYTVVLSPDLVSESGAKVAEAARQHQFASFVFRPRRMWEIEEKPGRVVLGLLFPAAVDTDALDEHLVVENLEGESIEYEIEPGEEGVVRLVFREGLEDPIRVKILKGLTDATGAVELAKDYLFVHPQAPFFAVESVQWGQFEGPEREIVIQFSKPVSAKALTESFSIARSDNGATVPFEVVSEGTNSEHRIRVEIPETDYPPIQVHLAKGMEGSQGRSLVEEYQATLETRPESLEVKSVRWGP